MGRVPYYCVLLYGVLYVQTKAVTFQKLRFVGRPGRRIEAARITGEYSLRSSVECLLMCSTVSTCDKIAWNEVTKQCQHTTDLIHGLKTYSSRLVLATNWISYEKNKYAVSLYRGPLGEFTLTFQDAMELCVTMGTTIASRETLLQARDEGYESCGCGWLSDGSNGFVMQSNVPGCYYYYTTGIHHCSQSITDVYCNVL